MSVHRTTLHRTARARAGRHPSTTLSSRTLTCGARLAQRLGSRLREDRGDVPGWVLITLMTAAIVIGLWAVASEQIIQIFNNAMAPFLDREL